jgi:polyribonucleotide nucleotidyltransferase
MFLSVPISHEILYHNQKLRLETGLLALQATASVVASIGETTVMANVVVGSPRGGDFFPLQVIYEEKMYASGKISGSRFIKREGRPSERSVLTGRMVDRSLRSLFDSHIRSEVQVIITVLSIDEINQPDTLAVLAASSALSLCGFKFKSEDLPKFIKITQTNSTNNFEVEEENFGSNDFKNNLEFIPKQPYQGPISCIRVGLKREKMGEVWLKKISESLTKINSFEDLKPLLTSISESLNGKNPEDREYLRQIARFLSQKNQNWAKDFSSFYKLVPKLSQPQITQKYKPLEEILINLSYEEQESSFVDLVISGNGKSVMMLEAGANIIDEETISKCLDKANQELEILTNFQQEFIQKATEKGLIKESVVEINLPEQKFEHYWHAFRTDLELALYYSCKKEEKKSKLEAFRGHHLQNLEALNNLIQKFQFTEIAKVREFLVENTNDPIHGEFSSVLNDQNLNLTISQNLLDLLESDNLGELKNIKTKLEEGLNEAIKHMVKEKILMEEKRIDGRRIDEIRPIICQIDVLPRVHGSSLFQRGETQILNILTLGGKSEAQLLDNMEDFEEGSKRYIHHYNFPAYSVGETGRYGAPGRREIGHGALAEKALLPVLPDLNEFPYTMRLVSECLGSNGSTSMASTCGSCLSLMAGGVPIKDIVAGIAMGLVIDENSGRFKVLTDIQGLEDYNGDMDFKVTGTKDGITAIQLDNKIAGLTIEILKKALLEAKNGRLFILDKMKESIKVPKPEISKYAPRVLSLQIPMDKVGDVIGPSGKTIKAMVLKYGVEIDIEDATGMAYIYGKDSQKVSAVKAKIEKIIAGFKSGDKVNGLIFRIESYGAFVKILDEDNSESGKEGLIHISNLSRKKLKDVEEVAAIGQTIECTILDVNEKGQIDLGAIDYFDKN